MSDLQFWVLVIVGTVGVIVFIGEVTGLANAFINSFY